MLVDIVLTLENGLPQIFRYYPDILYDLLIVSLSCGATYARELKCTLCLKSVNGSNSPGARSEYQLETNFLRNRFSIC